MPYKPDSKPDRIYLWIPADLKRRLQAVVARERKRTGYPISMSNFTRRALQEAIMRSEAGEGEK